MRGRKNVWVLGVNGGRNGVLFCGGEHVEGPHYHVGDIKNMLKGDRIVFADTKSELQRLCEIEVWMWNAYHPEKRVEPVKMALSLKPAVASGKRK